MSYTIEIVLLDIHKYENYIEVKLHVMKVNGTKFILFQILFQILF